MNRRGFLKMFAAVPVVSLVIPQFNLFEPEAPQIQLLDNSQWIGTVREMAQYSLTTDSILLRHDILGPGGDQFCVTSELTGLEYVALQRNRDIASLMLRDQMTQKGWTLKDLRPLPIPAGYQDSILAIIERAEPQTLAERFPYTVLPA